MIQRFILCSQITHPITQYVFSVYWHIFVRLRLLKAYELVDISCY